MKSYSFVAVIVVATAFSFAGCANQSSNTTVSATDPTERTYTRKDLNKSGRQETGEAIQALDPAVHVSSDR